MLRCLILFRSAAMSSSRRIVRPSSMLATISTYGRMCEFTKVESSSRKPSSGSVTFSSVASVASWDAESLTASAPRCARGASEDSSGVVGGSGRAGAAGTSCGKAASVSLTDLLRLPLRPFFFLLAESVSLCFLLRALPRWRRRCSRQPNAQRRFWRHALRGCVRKRIPQ